LDKDNILSFERQIATLLATIKTKDTEISFLKRSIDNQKNELKEARDQYSDALEQKAAIERQISEVKNSKMEL
jgi:phage shock protein A